MSGSREATFAGRNLWDELIQLRDTQRKERASGIQVVRRRDISPETNSQGIMRWYMHPEIKDIVLSTLSIYEQEIPPGSRSGRLQFQGGHVMFIVQGTGYTVIDGVKYPWKKKDVVNLPLKKDGIIVQHFNSSADEPVRFLLVEPNLFAATGVDRGCGFEQVESSPDYKP
jgi:gentisate 1,2-dioxygenase